LVYDAIVKVFVFLTVVSPLRAIGPVPVAKLPVPVSCIFKSLFAATVTSPLKLMAPVPVENVFLVPLWSFRKRTFPYTSRRVEVPDVAPPMYTLPNICVLPPEPALPTVRGVLSAICTAPAKLTCPVPDVNVLEPDMMVLPFRVTTPVPDWNVPDPAAVMCKFLLLATVV